MSEIEEGYLYVMHGHSAYVKIGITKNHPRERLKQLNSGTKLPAKIKLLRQIKTPHYRKTEQILHRALKEFRAEGEWFLLPPVALVALSFLNPSHIEELIDNPIHNEKELEKLVFGREGIILDATKPYLSEVEELSHRKIQEMRAEIRELKANLAAYQKALGRQSQSALQQQSIHNNIRSALKAIPTAIEIKHERNERILDESDEQGPPKDSRPENLESL